MSQLYSYFVATMGLLVIFGTWIIADEIQTIFENWAVAYGTVNANYYGFFVTIWGYIGGIAFFIYAIHLFVTAQRKTQGYY